ncbi:MAG: hypothetical protein AAF961_15450, partial [Planctomycetota bacterium]
MQFQCKLRMMRAPRYRLRSVLLAWAVVCAALAWVLVPAARQRRALSRLTELRQKSPLAARRSIPFVYQHNSHLRLDEPDESRYAYW